MQKVRMGMVGGGDGAFIGEIHRIAASLSQQIELVCGSFSRKEEVSQLTGQKLGLASERCYTDFETMYDAESSLPESQRMEMVAIVTPNKSHFEIAKQALQKEFHVFCEKPVTFSLKEALQLQSVLLSSEAQFALAHTYNAYPMVVEAKNRVFAGEIGEVTKVVADYSQGWLAPAAIGEGNKQSEWRLDPDYSGVSCCMGDIGVHAAQLAEFIIGSDISDVLSDLGHVVPERKLDDDGSAFLRFSSGARGLLNASQISVGEENNLSIRIYGSKGSLTWRQEEPNTLLLKYADKPTQIIRAAQGYNSQQSLHLTRTPPGHPEGYIEAFGNLYLQFAESIRGTSDSQAYLPGIESGVRGMAFIEAVVKSHQLNNKWINMTQLIELNKEDLS